MLKTTIKIGFLVIIPLTVKDLFPCEEAIAHKDRNELWESAAIVILREVRFLTFKEHSLALKSGL